MNLQDAVERADSLNKVNVKEHIDWFVEAPMGEAYAYLMRARYLSQEFSEFCLPYGMFITDTAITQKLVDMLRSDNHELFQQVREVYGG